MISWALPRAGSVPHSICLRMVSSSLTYSLGSVALAEKLKTGSASIIASTTMYSIALPLRCVYTLRNRDCRV